MPYDRNPYGGVAGSINDLTRNLIALKGQQMHMDLGAAELGMRERQLAETAKARNLQYYGTEQAGTGPTIPQQNLEETKRLRQVQESAQAATEAKDPNVMPLKRPSILKTMIGLKTNIGLDDKDVSEVFSPVLEMVGMPRGQAYDMLKAQGPQLNQVLLQKVSDTYEKKLSDPKNGMAFAQSPQAKAMEAFIDHLDSDKDLSKTFDNIFPDIARHRAESATQARLTIAAERMKPENQYMDAAKRLISAGDQDYEGKAEDMATVQSFDALNEKIAKRTKEGKIVVPRQERLVQAVDENGNTVWMPASEAVGKKTAPKAGDKDKFDPIKAETKIITNSDNAPAFKEMMDQFNKHTPDTNYGYFEGTSGKVSKIIYGADDKGPITNKRVNEIAAKKGWTHGQVVDWMIANKLAQPTSLPKPKKAN